MGPTRTVSLRVLPIVWCREPSAEQRRCRSARTVAHAREIEREVRAVADDHRAIDRCVANGTTAGLWDGWRR